MEKPYILLAEDNADDERLTVRALRKALPGIHVEVVRDGQEAANRLLKDEFEPRPHLVVLDIQMPKLSGLDVLEMMRQCEHCKSLPVVILTVSDDQSDVDFAYRHRANSYIRKPVHSEEFADIIGRLGLYWLTVNLAPK